MGVLCAKLKLHKITPNAQGIRHYDVMISGEVQSLALPLTPREVKRNHKYEVRFLPTAGGAALAEDLVKGEFNVTRFQ